MFITNSTLLQKRWQAPGRPNILCDQRLPSRRERRKAAAIHQNCVWAARSRPGSSERATNRVCSPSELLSGKNTDLGKKGDFRALQVGQHTFGRSFKTLLELPLGPKFSWHVQCCPTDRIHNQLVSDSTPGRKPTCSRTRDRDHLPLASYQRFPSQLYTREN